MNDTIASPSLQRDSARQAPLHSVGAHVGDVLALEHRIREPLTRTARLDATTGHPEAMRVIARLDLMTDVHIEALEQDWQRLDGSDAAFAPPAATAVTVVDLGASRISEHLRDDFAALSLASICYVMLHAVALGAGAASTVALAERHLIDVNGAIDEIRRTLPNVMLNELRADGVAVTPEARRSMLLNVTDAWSDSGT